MQDNQSKFNVIRNIMASYLVSNIEEDVNNKKGP